MKLFLQRVKDDPLPDIHTLVQHTEVDREYSGYMLRMGEQTIDLVEHLAITEEEADEYYYLKLRSDGTGYVQFGSEEMSGNIRWNETTFFAEDDDDPAPYTREGDHILMDLNGTVVEFAPIKEVEALVGVKIWELNNTAVQLPEELIDLFDYNTPLWGMMGTGDETPVYPYVFGGAGVLAVVALLVFGKKRKKSRQ